jgi:hypothetical protein
MNEKKLLIENLILSSLAIDDETAGLLIKDVLHLDEEMKQRLKSAFLKIDISENYILEILKHLWNSKLVDCVLEDGKTLFEKEFEDIPIEIDNYEVWFRLTEIGNRKLEETNKLIWIDA